MKTKVIIILSALALITLSFTFTTKQENPEIKKSRVILSKEFSGPSGGFLSEDKF